MGSQAISADELLQRLREACFGFPAVEEKVSHGAPSFFVRGGKMFATFADDHHGDGRTAVWLKATHERQRELVAEGPERYYVPPYVGVSGWVGVHLGEATDWDELTILLEDGWSAVAPKSAHNAPVLPPPAREPLAKTDPAVAAAAYTKLEGLALGLDGVEVERDKWAATFRVKKKPFAYFHDSHHGDGRVAVWVKVAAGENVALAAAKPNAYFVPPYLGPRGWVGVRLDQKKVDWKDVAARLAASHAATGAPPKKAAAASRGRSTK